MESKGPRAQAIYREVCQLGETLAKKNADYGDATAQPPRLAPGVTAEQAILVRMGDKINRLETLLGSGRDPLVDESIRDTIRDLAGYSILYLAAETTQ